MLKIENLRTNRGDFYLYVQDLEIAGRNSFIFGRNGSGKSTLLLCIAGLQVHEGKIMKNNRDITSLPPEKRDIALIPQELDLFPNMNVMKNITISIRYGKGNDEILDEVIDALGIRRLLSKKTWELSQGEAQRVAVARALVSSPSLMLMDEPFSMQDEISRINSLSLIDDLSKKYGFEYIYVTHNPKDLDLGFSTLVTLDGGKVVESTHSPEEIVHYRTLSLLDYARIINLNGKYYRISEEKIKFNEFNGYDYEVFNNDGVYLLKILIEGNYAFIRFHGKIGGKKIILDDALEEIPY